MIFGASWWWRTGNESEKSERWPQVNAQTASRTRVSLMDGHVVVLTALQRSSSVASVLSWAEAQVSADRAGPSSLVRMLVRMMSEWTAEKAVSPVVDDSGDISDDVVSKFGYVSAKDRQREIVEMVRTVKRYKVDRGLYSTERTRRVSGK